MGQRGSANCTANTTGQHTALAGQAAGCQEPTLARVGGAAVARV